MPTNRRQGLGLWPKNNMKRLGERMDFSRLEAENSSENVVDRRGDDPGRDMYNRRVRSIQNDPSFMPHEKESELSRLNTMNFYPEDNAAVPRTQMGVDAGLDDVSTAVSPIMDYSGRDPLEDHMDEAEREGHVYTPSVMDKFDIAPVPTTPETEESEDYNMAYADGGLVEDEEDFSDDYGFDYGTTDNYSAPDDGGVLQFDDEPLPEYNEPEYAEAPQEEYDTGSAIPPEVSEAFNYGRSAHGLASQGVVDDPGLAGGMEPDPAGYFGGTDAMPTANVQAIERQIDPSGVMDEGTRKLLAVQELANQGGPEAAWGLLAHYNQKANAFAALATAAAEGTPQKPANLQQAVEAANKALANVVDGTTTVFRAAGDRIVAHISNNSTVDPNVLDDSDAMGLPGEAPYPVGIRRPDAVLRDTVVLPVQAFVNWLKGGGASPDAVVEAGGTKAALEAAAQAPGPASEYDRSPAGTPPPQQAQPAQPAQSAGQPPLQSGASLAQVPHVSQPTLPPRPRPGGPALAENDPRFSVDNGRSIYTDAAGKKHLLRQIPGADPEVMLAMAKARPWVSQGDQLAQEEAAYLQKNRAQLNDLEGKRITAEEATSRALGAAGVRAQGQQRVAETNVGGRLATTGMRVESNERMAAERRAIDRAIATGKEFNANMRKKQDLAAKAFQASMLNGNNASQASKDAQRAVGDLGMDENEFLRYIMHQPTGGGAPQQAPQQSAPAQRPARQQQSAVPPAAQRQEGQAYTTPRGQMVWTGKGWLTPQQWTARQRGSGG